ncbi:MAG TPA: F0F1 ATP synthase assembly protein I [Allosphingosinicella sp.]|nr:F0F1 ATP synthase assembly protein I [Allosphingosinicella sp.]
MAGSFAGMSHLTAARFLRRGRTSKDGMAESEPWQDPKSPQDARLASLDERLRQAQAAGEAKRTGGNGTGAAPYYRSPGYRVLSVLVGYPLGCALIGYAIDSFAGTRGAWVVMVFVGFGVAIWEVWKISQQGPK